MFNLVYQGSVQVPSVESGKFGALYQSQYQAVCPVDGATNEVFMSFNKESGYKMHVARVSLPEPVIANLNSVPVAKVVGPVVPVGKEYYDMIVGSGGPPHYPNLQGITQHEDKLWLNYSKFYHVDPATYPNLNSININLDPATETKLRDIDLFGTSRPHVKNHSGFLAKIPAGWHKQSDIVRGNYWQNSDDGGPRVTTVDVHSTRKTGFPWGTLISHNNKNTVEDWSPTDVWRGMVFIEKDKQKYAGILVTKGTPPGWYGDGNAGPGGLVDKCSSAKGYHAYPYSAQMWFYKWSEMTEVLGRRRATHSLLPVQKVIMPGYVGECKQAANCFMLNGRLWAMQLYATRPKPGDAYNLVNVLHCYIVE